MERRSTHIIFGGGQPTDGSADNGLFSLLGAIAAHATGGTSAMGFTPTVGAPGSIFDAISALTDTTGAGGWIGPFTVPVSTENGGGDDGGPFETVLRRLFESQLAASYADAHGPSEGVPRALIERLPARVHGDPRPAPFQSPSVVIADATTSGMDAPVRGLSELHDLPALEEDPSEPTPMDVDTAATEINLEQTCTPVSAQNSCDTHNIHIRRNSSTSNNDDNAAQTPRDETETHKQNKQKKEREREDETEKEGEERKRKRNGEQGRKTDACAICLEEPEIGQKVRDLPCGHTYHADCIDRWLESHTQCPCCRQRPFVLDELDLSEDPEVRRFAANLRERDAIQAVYDRAHGAESSVPTSEPTPSTHAPTSTESIPDAQADSNAEQVSVSLPSALSFSFPFLFPPSDPLRSSTVIPARVSTATAPTSPHEQIEANGRIHDAEFSHARTVESVRTPPPLRPARNGRILVPGPVPHELEELLATCPRVPPTAPGGPSLASLLLDSDYLYNVNVPL